MRFEEISELCVRSSASHRPTDSGEAFASTCTNPFRTQLYMPCYHADVFQLPDTIGYSIVLIQTVLAIVLLSMYLNHWLMQMTYSFWLILIYPLAPLHRAWFPFESWSFCLFWLFTVGDQLLSMPLSYIVYFDVEIIMRVCRTETVPFRPFLKCEIGADPAQNQLLQLVSKCWHQEPAVRPNFTHISAEFMAINRGK